MCSENNRSEQPRSWTFLHVGSGAACPPGVSSSLSSYWRNLPRRALFFSCSSRVCMCFLCLFLFLEIIKQWRGRGGKVLHYPSSYQNHQMFLKTALALGDCFVKEFGLRRPVGRTDDFRTRWLLRRFLLQWVHHAANLLPDQMLLLRDLPNSPKAWENSLKLRTSLVKNFSVDFKWNANSLTFFKHTSQPRLCTHFKSGCVVGGGAVRLEQLSDVLFLENSKLHFGR